MLKPRSLGDLEIRFQPRIVDRLAVQKRKTLDGVEYTIVPNDISFLTQQNRLLSLPISEAEQILQSYKSVNTELADVFDKCSDEELMSTVKSRYIQSTTDLKNWTRSLSQTVKSALEYHKERLKSLERDKALDKKDGNNE